jgi:hypothetical protein
MSPIRLFNHVVVALTALAILPATGLAQEPQTGGIAGSVATERGEPLPDVTIRVIGPARLTREALSGSGGQFALPALPAGMYEVTARRLGYREALSPPVRVTSGQVAELRIVLTASPTQLSTVSVVVSPTAIDATTTELTTRIDARNVELLPLGRDATALVELVPGARRGFIWGGAADAANNYQIDGVAVNHPGIGGDFLVPGLDWVEAVEVRGLGAGAEHGGFQGAIVNAITPSGGNVRRGSVGVNYISPAWTSSNIRPNEEGNEQVERREITGQSRGPIVPDRLFYFVTGQFVQRYARVADLRPDTESPFREARQEFSDVRVLGKLTLAPSARDRVNVLGGYMLQGAERAELDGLNDLAASRRVRAPIGMYGGNWLRTGRSGSFEARLLGFAATETREGYAGSAVPAIQVFRIGRQPVHQNAVFNDRVEPHSIGGGLARKLRHALLGGENELVTGIDYALGSWRHFRTRNGGLTWRPYMDPNTGAVDPAQPTSWVEVASDWGGEIRLRSRHDDLAAYVQNYFTPWPEVTLAAGLRYGRWSGWLDPAAGDSRRFLAVRADGIDPRVGLVWDVSRRNTFVLKAHWGRYHQSMSSFFFDRTSGADAYSNQRFYFQGPDITDPRQVYTAEERDMMLDQNTGFSPVFSELTRNESGRVENYRQPYIDQSVFGVEKTFGPRWKAEFSFTSRINKDIPGLIDRNLAENYSPIADVAVRHRITFAPVADQSGNALILPVVWVANNDLRDELLFRLSAQRPPVPGYTFADTARLTFRPDIVLTTLPDARRRTEQGSFSIRTEQSSWNAFWSVTVTRLRGNSPGLTGFGTVSSSFTGIGTGATSFTAGPHVRPNEAINYEGRLPNFVPLESKLWVGAQLPYGFRGGAFARYARGEYYSPVFEITPRFRFVSPDGLLLLDDTFETVLGQTVLLEQRGYRQYESQTVLDLRLERRFGAAARPFVVAADVFNALASDAITARNLTINDQVASDPTSRFEAPRRRLEPVVLRLSARLDF